MKMHRSRGFGLLEFGIVVAGLLALAAVVWGIYSKGVEAGESAKQLEWLADNAKKAADQRRREQGVDDTILALQKERDVERIRAEENDRKWREARRNADRSKVSLAGCDPAPSPEPTRTVDASAGSGLQPPASASGGAAPHTPGGVRFAWEFVFAFDSAWTGADGKPVSQDPAGRGGAELAGLSPYDPADVLAVHGENAQACSKDRRELGSLMKRLQAASDAWERSR